SHRSVPFGSRKSPANSNDTDCPAWPASGNTERTAGCLIGIVCVALSLALNGKVHWLAPNKVNAKIPLLNEFTFMPFDPGTSVSEQRRTFGASRLNNLLEENCPLSFVHPRTKALAFLTNLSLRQMNVS